LCFVGSDEQRELVEWIESLGLSIQQNVRIFDDSKKEIDILIPLLNIAIEYCGIYWHCDIHDRIDKNYHKDKYIGCKNKGIRLITIFQTEWINKKELIKQKLLNILHKSTTKKISARKCTIQVTTTTKKNEFHSLYHIQGQDKSPLVYGLYYQDELVACLSGKLHDGTFDLTRFSSKYSIVGGFSKLLKFVEQHTRCDTIITFADLRWSNGDLYHNTGFNIEYIIPPTFYYYDNNKKVLLHRSNFMKHKIIKQYGFDESMTEFQMCDQLDVLRIWDCGKIKFSKQVTNDST